MNWCRLHRWVAAFRLDDGAALPAFARRHLDGCASCRAHYERERQCAQLLATQARAARLPAPPFLRQRVLANLASWEHDHTTTPRGRWWTLAACVAAMMLAFWLLVWPRLDSGPDASRAPVPSEAMAALKHLATGATVLELGAQLDGPLQSEWDSVMLDARNALAALARNFAPRERVEQH